MGVYREKKEIAERQSRRETQSVRGNTAPTGRKQEAIRFRSGFHGKLTYAEARIDKRQSERRA